MLAGYLRWHTPGAAFIRPTRRVLRLAGALTLALLAYWAATRWGGLPLGPNLWLAEDRANGDTDIARAVLQALAAPLFLLLGARQPRRRPRWWWVALRAAPVLLLAAVLTYASLPGGGAAHGAPLASVAAGRMTTLIYCSPGGVRLAMDLYEPPASAAHPVPAVLYVHGGGWVYGDRASDALYFPYRQFVADLTTRGFVVASIDYRLASLYPFPAPIEDAKCAVRFLRANAGALGIDPGRIGAFGGSAGGSTVALLGMTGTPAAWDAGQYQGQSSRVQAVADMSGPVDFTPSGRWDAPTDLIGRIGMIGASAATRRAASAVAYSGAGAPPFLIVHGTADPVVPPTQSSELAARLRAAGASARLVLLPGAGHVNDAPFAAQIGPAVDFLVAALAPGATAR